MRGRKEAKVDSFSLMQDRNNGREVPMTTVIHRLTLTCALAMLLAAIAGCGGTATPSPTPLPVATATSLPTATPPPAPTATSAPTATPTPSPTPGTAKRVTFKPGQVVDVKPGIFFADIATGAIEGWQLPLDTAGGWVNRISGTSLSPDGRFILYPAAKTLDDWSDWSLLDTRTGKTCVLPEVRSWTGAFSPDGQSFVANTALGSALMLSDCVAGPQSLDLPVDEQLDYAVWSPDGKTLMVVTHRNLPESKMERMVTSYLINQARKDPVVVDQGPGRPISPIWSPDGTHVVVVSPSWGKVQVLDQAGGVVWATSLAVSSVWNRGWSPDGRSIVLAVDVYTDDRTRRSYVYILDAATGKTQFRVLGAFAACGQMWTPDSQWFLIWSYGLNERPERAPYYLVAADGSVVRQLEDDPTGYAAYLNSLLPNDASRAVVHGRTDASGHGFSPGCGSKDWL